MKLNKMALVAAMVGSLAVAGTAGAANWEINIYGASAEYTFFNAVAPSFLQNTFSCNPALTTQATGFSGTQGITQAFGCTVNGQTNQTMILRYASKASYDGILSVQGNTTNPNVTLSDCGAGSPFQRKLADETQTAGGVVSGTKCVDVTIGASDVAGTTFSQATHGQYVGPYGGGWTNRDFTGGGAVNPAGLNFYNPLVVPFGFFINKDVTVMTCTGGDQAGKQQCTTNADCAGTGGACGAATTITNISRMQAVNIFTGQVSNWTDFGAGYVELPIVACLRHAGSGTMATLDYGVIKGHGWSAAPLVTTETYNGNSNGAAGPSPYTAVDATWPADATIPVTPTWGAGDAAGETIWFNNGSSDEMKCVNSQAGSIGYSDSDQLTGSGPGTYPNAAAVSYNGFFPNRVNIRNGLYDDFWTNEWLYYNPSHIQSIYPSTYTVYETLIADLNSFAGNPANLTTTSSLGTKAEYWATQGEMAFEKNVDSAYPAYIGQSGLVTP